MTTFTRTSPTGGAVPTGVTEIGGIVLDLIGTNGVRVTSQLAASSLYVGFYDSGTPASYQGNPGTIGIQTGLSSVILSALGGGLSSVSVRITLFDGDTAPGDFDDQQNLLNLNGITLGNFSSVSTQETSADGLTLISTTSGFANDTLDTGWFSTTNAAFLASFYSTLVSTGQVRYALNDLQNLYDNFFDFTRGVDGGLINVGVSPNISPAANNDSASTQKGAPVTINVAANDFDTDGTIAAYMLGTAPANGTFVLNANNTITYTPNANFVGTDTFTYSVTDDRGATDSATVTVTVTAAPTSSGGVIRLSSGNDVVSYNTSTSGVLVQSLAGDDSITGSNFDDSINGGEGTDLIRGGGGKDVITGGAGFDRVQGGAGNDTFVFARGDLVNPINFGGNMDHIIDFHGAGGYTTGENDFIRFTGFGAGSVVFDHFLGNDPTKQIYNVLDSGGVYQGSLLVQMADGTNKLAGGDYVFA